MFGLPVDTVRKGVMKTCSQLGPHPKWNSHDETFAFKKVPKLLTNDSFINFMFLFCVHRSFFQKFACYDFQ